MFMLLVWDIRQRWNENIVSFFESKVIFSGEIKNKKKVSAWVCDWEREIMCLSMDVNEFTKSKLLLYVKFLSLRFLSDLFAVGSCTADNRKLQEAIFIWILCA